MQKRQWWPVVILVIIQFVLLVLQFIIGMFINLFAPMNISVTQNNYFMMGYMMEVFIQVPALFPHMFIGFITGIISLIMVLLAILNGKTLVAILALLNGFLILTAGIAGIYFVLSGLSNNALSFLMSIGFIGAVAVDFGILYLVV